MSIDDQGDVWRELREMKRKIARLESGSMLENSSITRGRMRFIGGLLRVDSGGRVEIVGTLAVEGTSQFVGPVTISGPWTFSGNGNITGNVTATGKWTQNGAWEFNGDGDITGDVDVSGDLTVLGNGRIVVSGATPVHIIPGSGTAPARIRLGTGSQDPVIRGGDGLGRIETPDGKTGVYVGSGSASIVYDQDPGNPLQDSPRIGVGSQGVTVRGLKELPAGTTGAKYVVEHQGVLYTSAGVGGGGGAPSPGEDLGNFQWPFALTTVTSEYGPRTSPYTGFHEGIDFGISPAVAGAPIIAAGDGTVAVSTFASGWGNHVRITHTVAGGQQVSTLYAHMNAAPLVGVGATVTKGQTIGYVGNTGNSYGAHLHFETWMGTGYGTHVNPRSFMAAYGPA